MSDCKKRVENTTSESLWDVNGKRHLLSILPPKHRTQTIWQNFVILTSPTRLGEWSKKGLFTVRLTVGVDPPILRSAFKHSIYSFSSAKPGMILNVFLKTLFDKKNNNCRRAKYSAPLQFARRCFIEAIWIVSVFFYNIWNQGSRLEKYVWGVCGSQEARARAKRKRGAWQWTDHLSLHQGFNIFEHS